MKKHYESLEAEIITFEPMDIITTSGDETERLNDNDDSNNNG